MTITFRLRFSSRPGQSLWLEADPPLASQPAPMQYRDGEHWEASATLGPQAAAARFNYSYLLEDAGGSRTADWGRDRFLVPADYHCQELLVLDSWNYPGYVENVFYTAPFKNVLHTQNVCAVSITSPERPTHTFRVKAPQLKKNQTLCLLGEGAALGGWRTQAPILMARRSKDDYFGVSLDLRGQPMPLAYKYGVFDAAQNVFLRYEDGANRVLTDEARAGRRVLINDGFARLPLEPWRGAGVAVPVFSLRREKSFGVGEFADLKLLADWGGQTGLKLIQLLPINDTSATGTWKDSYPYAAISAFALHPIYINLAAVAGAQNQALLRALEPERKRLNASDSLDYEPVMKAKLSFLRHIFPSQKAATLSGAGYKSFFEENRDWLVPYAAFCVLRDKFGTADFNQWPDCRRFDAQKIAGWMVAGAGQPKTGAASAIQPPTAGAMPDEIAFHCFVQYHLHLQLTDAAAHVHAAGLVLKGDLAIGVSRHSADTWQAPHLYHLERQAGAPPDAFSAKGQNWGFPTYNWPRMSADGFAWWKQRFAQMGRYFDAFRVDHILGFFRIWSIPEHAVEGILGYFAPALPVEPGELIPLDIKRLLKPFITDAVLDEMFGNEADGVRREFLAPAGGGLYELKPEFATQRQVADYFAARGASNPPSALQNHHASNGAAMRPPAAADEKIKIGLFDLISNVILIQADGSLHFRFAMEQTSSFRDLPGAAQARLHDLYVDYFFRRQDGFWKREALQKLPALKRVTEMLICGEDLGLVPACVPDVMRDLGFLGLEIQRMPKAMGRDFSRPADAPYLSVVTPATHDMSTIRGWWEEDRDLTQRFMNHELGLPGAAPAAAGPRMVCEIVRQHLFSPAMWSIFQLQDLLGMDETLRRNDIGAERINVPALPNFYWRYRMHLSLEKLLDAGAFNAQLRQMITDAGR